MYWGIQKIVITQECNEENNAMLRVPSWGKGP